MACCKIMQHAISQLWGHLPKHRCMDDPHAKKKLRPTTSTNSNFGVRKCLSWDEKRCRPQITVCTFCSKHLLYGNAASVITQSALFPLFPKLNKCKIIAFFRICEFFYRQNLYIRAGDMLVPMIAQMFLVVSAFQHFTIKRNHITRI